MRISEVEHPRTGTCYRCYKIVDRPCQSDTETYDCPHLEHKPRLPVYVQPPNQPELGTRVCYAPEDAGKRDVIKAVVDTGIAADRIVDAKLMKGEHPRWRVVAI